MMKLHVACLLALSVGLAMPTVAGKTPPNVLIVLADDLGFSDLSCYGGEISTPHLDALAASGLRYSAFYSSARCCPSRASLMTGLHPHEAGIGSFATARPEAGKGPAYTGHLLPQTATVAEVLGRSGYTTWMVGKWHMGNPGPVERGFQNYYGYKNMLSYAEDQWRADPYIRLPDGKAPEIAVKDGDYATDVFTAYSLEFLRQAREAGKPWLLYLAHSSPHFPVQAPRASVKKHVATYRKGWDVLRAGRLERMKKLGVVPDDTPLPPLSAVPVDDPKITDGYGGKRNPAWSELPADRREDLAWRMATYAAMVEHVDLGIGRLVEDLKRNHDLENTLILFLSDNGACYEWGPFGFDGASRRGTNILRTGEDLARTGQPGTSLSYGSAWANLSNTPLRSYKHFCHEGGIAGPMIAHWPAGLKIPGQWVHDPAHLMDVLPTVIEATGAAYPEERDGHRMKPLSGVSLVPHFAGKSIPGRPLAFEHQGARGLRHGDWKIVWGKRQVDAPRWELYHLSEDRCEQRDLSETESERRDALVAEWNAWAEKVGVQTERRARK